jgi:TatA/E family protein of Tat protein translocase
MFDIGGGELLLILIAVVLLFGPKKLPEIAQMIGRGMQQVRKAQAQFTSQMNEVQNEVKKSVDDNPITEFKKTIIRDNENHNVETDKSKDIIDPTIK